MYKNFSHKYKSVFFPPVSFISFHRFQSIQAAGRSTSKPSKWRAVIEAQLSSIGLELSTALKLIPLSRLPSLPGLLDVCFLSDSIPDLNSRIFKTGSWFSTASTAGNLYRWITLSPQIDSVGRLDSTITH